MISLFVFCQYDTLRLILTAEQVGLRIEHPQEVINNIQVGYIAYIFLTVELMFILLVSVKRRTLVRCEVPSNHLLFYSF